MRFYRAGETIEDVCRACKLDRVHTVIAVDGDGHPVRVECDYCHSQHNFRGGARDATHRTPSPATPSVPQPAPQAVAHPGPHPAVQPGRSRPAAAPPIPLVSEHERAAEPIPMSPHESIDLELLLRRIIRQEAGLTPVVPAEKWRGGTVVLKPGNPALQERTWPIDTLFHKIVMIRNRLRTLEQQVNGMDLPEDVKIKLQGYVTGCYGSLTSFNVLFADEADQFKGAGGD
jgi:hypothetical protein